MGESALELSSRPNGESPSKVEKQATVTRMRWNMLKGGGAEMG